MLPSVTRSQVGVWSPGLFTEEPNLPLQFGFCWPVMLCLREYSLPPHSFPYMPGPFVSEGSRIAPRLIAFGDCF